jgi:hypothetical protein
MAVVTVRPCKWSVKRTGTRQRRHDGTVHRAIRELLEGCKRIVVTVQLPEVPEEVMEAIHKLKDGDPLLAGTSGALVDLVTPHAPLPKEGHRDD